MTCDWPCLGLPVIKLHSWTSKAFYLFKWNKYFCTLSWWVYWVADVSGIMSKFTKQYILYKVPLLIFISFNSLTIGRKRDRTVGRCWHTDTPKWFGMSPNQARKLMASHDTLTSERRFDWLILLSSRIYWSAGMVILICKACNTHINSQSR